MRAPNGILLKPIPVAPNDDYMAGEDGQVYSRTKYKGFGKKIVVPWYPLKGSSHHPKGYVTISMSHQNKRVTKNVHRLVCMAFHGMPEKPSMQVRHLDGDPANNRPSNLRWGTQQENWADRRAHGRVALGEKHHAAKLTNREREHLRWAIGKGLCSQRHAARILGMSQASIQKIVQAGTNSG